MTISRRSLSLILFLLLLVSAAVLWFHWSRSGDDRPALPETRETLGLFTSLPIYWNESDDLSAMLDGGEGAHWARAAIERQRPIQPIDVLSAEGLAGYENLLVAQPRALSPAENVALDDWVRGGGRLLLFADPMLTQHSRFALGDKRRPMDVALLSPILARWGLELRFDEGQPAGEHGVALLGSEVPVDLPGLFTSIPVAADAPAQCTLLAQGLAADCRVGRGRALIVADAALLDGEGADPAARAEVLSALMGHAYAAG